MPFLEVYLAQPEPPTRPQKRAFAAELLVIVAEELGTKPGSLRLVVRHIAPDDTLAILDEAGEDAAGDAS